MADFSSVPRRIFVDSCTAQVWGAYGGFIHEGEEIDADDPIMRVPTGLQDLAALRDILTVSQSAQFEWIVSDNSRCEAARKRDHHHSRWIGEINAHAQYCLDDDGPDDESARLAASLYSPRFGYLGVGDRELLADAVYLRCDTFLTIERKLPKNAAHIEEHLGIRVITPPEHWRVLQPWAAVWT